MDAASELGLRVIVRQLLFYVQLSARPDSLAAHVAELVQTQHGHSREQLLVAVDWALSQPELRPLLRQPHDDAVLRRYLEEIVAQLR